MLLTQHKLDAIGTVTLDDAAAIAALIEEVEAYVSYYAGTDAQKSEIDALYAELVGTKGAANGKTVYQLNAELRGAQIKEFRAMVAKLPADGSDVAGLKAARAFYDALSRTAKYGGTGDNDGQNGAYYASAYDKMADLEKLVVFAAEDVKAYLQDLSVKARSAKTAKGNVKVTVVADVDALIEAGYTVEYKFYRSTKSNKGFQLKKTTEEGTYTNTSGKKGTKYFYKAVIVVKDAEGVEVAKTPLKHCLYASRTWSK